MITDIASRRMRPAKDKNSLEHLQYVRYLICTSFPVTAKNQTELRNNIDLFATLLHRGNAAQLENIESLVQGDKLQFLAEIYYNSESFPEIKAQVIMSYAYLLQNLTGSVLTMLIQSESMQNVLIYSLVSSNLDIRGYATASLKFLASSITVQQLKCICIKDECPFLITVMNCYPASERDQRIAIKGMILAALQHSRSAMTQLSELFEWICRVVLGPFVSYLCFELLIVTMELGSLSDGPACPLHDPAKSARVKELHERISDIFDFFIDISETSKSKSKNEDSLVSKYKIDSIDDHDSAISRIAAQRLIELVIGPVLMASLRQCRFGPLETTSIGWPIRNFPVQSYLDWCGSDDECDNGNQANLSCDTITNTISNGIIGDRNSQSKRRHSRTQSISSFVTETLGESANAMQKKAPVLPVHVALTLLLHLMNSLGGSTIGRYIYSIFFSVEDSSQSLQDLIVCPIVTGALITIISSFEGLARDSIMPSSPNARQHTVCQGPAVVREWCDHIIHTHNKARDPVLVHLIGHVVHRYMELQQAYRNDVLELSFIRFYIIYYKFAQSCKEDPARWFASMNGPEFIRFLLSSVYKRNLRYITLSELTDMVAAYRECLSDSQLQDLARLASEQVDILSALATHENESSAMHLDVCCSGHSKDWKALFSDKTETFIAHKPFVRSIAIYTTLSLYQEEPLPYSVVVSILTDVKNVISPKALL